MPEIPINNSLENVLEQLRRSEAMLLTAQRFAKLGSWEFDLHTQNLIWSDELYRIYGINPGETPKEKLFEEYLSRFAEEDKPELFRCIEDAVKNGKRYDITHRICLPDGTMKWIYGSGVPIRDVNGNIYKLAGYGQDITDRKNTEIELDLFFKLSNELLCMANFNGYFLKVSSGWKDALGYELDELTRIPFMEFVHPEDVEKTVIEMSGLREGHYTRGFENRYRHKNGSYRTFVWNAAPHLSTGMIYCVTRDITQEREAENKLKTALHDKEMLLKEVHHRVKNNLQIISSLLSLQGNYVDNPTLYNILNESKARVKSMSSVHELLYQSEDLVSIDFEKYLCRLVTDLKQSYFGNECHFQVNCQVKVSFGVDTAIPLGLLLNEIISNSFKHGIKNLSDHGITILIESLDEHNYRLTTGDTGPGFDFKSLSENNPSMGIMLIQELANQLNAKFTYLNKPGAWYQFDFSVI